jgi:hypothetical protein
MRAVGSLWLQAVGVLGVVVSFMGCGEPEESQVDVSSALSQNSGYLQGQTLAAKANTSAGQAVIFNNKAYLPYIRTDSHIGIVVDSNLSNNGGQTATTIGMSDLSNFGAALFVWNGWLNLIYVGQNSNLYMRRTADGLTWGNTVALDTEGFWEFVPSVVALDNSTFSIFCVANALGNNILLQVVVAGTTVNGIYNYGAVTNRGVATASWNGQAYLAWPGTDGNNTIHIQHTAQLNPPANWTGSALLAVGGYPSLLPLSTTTMELVLRGNDSFIYRVYTNDGVSFGAATKDGSSTTNQKPSAFMAQGGSNAWVFYIGQNNGLYTALE